MRTGSAVQQFEIVAGELRRREGGEHELGVEAEQVERPTPLGGVEGAEAMPALGAHHVDVGGVERVGRRSPGLRPGDRVLRQRARAAELEWTDPFTDAGLGVRGEPARQLHQMAVGVEVAATGGVHHPAIVARPVARRQGRPLTESRLCGCQWTFTMCIRRGWCTPLARYSPGQ